MASKTEIWWASVGGNPCEPIRVVREKGKQVFYSIGCNDAHPMDGVVLVHEADIPLSPVESEHQKQTRDKRFKKAMSEGTYSYRRFE